MCFAPAVVIRPAFFITIIDGIRVYDFACACRIDGFVCACLQCCGWRSLVQVL